MPENVIAGRYRLVSLLGRGGMSEVWSAEDRELGRRVAIKLLAPNADTLRFEREARAFASLAHPNVTQLYDYGEEDGRPYMVLEYVPGGTLEERLSSGKPLPDDEALATAAGIAAGLAHAHARGVVHRDLKPANVLYDEEGRPKLADFGIARLAAGEGTFTEAGTVLGTAAYISPEQATGEGATPASDVYSFGVILYRMLTGRLPFEADDPMELVVQHRDAAPPPISTIRPDAPGRLESTATAALAKNPAERPRDGAALLEELGVQGTAGAPATAILAGEGVTQVLPTAAAGTGAGAGAAPTAIGPRPPETAAGPPGPPPHRSRLPIALAILAVIALAGAALAYAMTRSSSPGDDTSTFTPVTLPKASTTETASTSTPATTEQTTSEPTTTEPATTHERTTTEQETTAPPTTTTPPTTTEPATTATTEPPTTATTATTDAGGLTVTIP